MCLASSPLSALLFPAIPANFSLLFAVGSKASNPFRQTTFRIKSGEPSLQFAENSPAGKPYTGGLESGAATLTTPSNELYSAMQTGACDACITSSTSLISFRLEEVAKSLTTGRGKSFWFMLVPLIMSKQIFDVMPKAQRDIMMELGAELEQFGIKEAMADDQKVAEVYAKKGATVADLDAAAVDKWRGIARATAWKDYAQKTALSAELIQLAEQVS